MPVELTDKFFNDVAGWQTVKQARAYLAQGQVVSSNWSPPLLRGVVRVGEIFFRASLVIKDEADIENLCTCREARESGRICAHVVAVGLHWLKTQNKAPVTPTLPVANASSEAKAAVRKPSALRRDAAGVPAELCVLFPPNFDQALARGAVMLVLESRWPGGRGPLNALPKDRAYTFSQIGRAH